VETLNNLIEKAFFEYDYGLLIEHNVTLNGNQSVAPIIWGTDIIRNSVSKRMGLGDGEGRIMLYHFSEKNLVKGTLIGE